MHKSEVSQGVWLLLHRWLQNNSGQMMPDAFCRRDTASGAVLSQQAVWLGAVCAVHSAALMMLDAV